MVQPLSEKVVFFTNLGQGFSKRVFFFLVFESLEKNIGYLKHEIHVCPCFWHFGLWYFHNYAQISFER